MFHRPSRQLHEHSCITPSVFQTEEEAAAAVPTAAESSSWQDSVSERPPYSYMAMIQFAINSTEKKRMTLKDIYTWIEDHFPYFKHVAKPGWKVTSRPSSCCGWCYIPSGSKWKVVPQPAKQDGRSFKHSTPNALSLQMFTVPLLVCLVSSYLSKMMGCLITGVRIGISRVHRIRDWRQGWLGTLWTWKFGVVCTLECNPSARGVWGRPCCADNKTTAFQPPPLFFLHRTPSGTTCPFMICLSVRHLPMVKSPSGLFTLMQTAA